MPKTPKTYDEFVKDYLRKYRRADERINQVGDQIDKLKQQQSSTSIASEEDAEIQKQIDKLLNSLNPAYKLVYQYEQREVDDEERPDLTEEEFFQYHYERYLESQAEDHSDE
ncbi:MAG: hypothetical protein DWQ31_06715 [Planctomycetota bacterium]|nr:MAG: hypothetical protein DWQ31_06715 [Planctomycetota bacterium]REJ90332.1 MAG: hypothetical protein DWQ35_16790 [Planctomycetota bacterium]